MNYRGVTLLELLIVIVVLGIISAFAATSAGNIIENTAVKVDERNAEILEDVITTAAADGTLIIKSNRLFNTETNRAYSGTGQWFFDDMGGYLENKVVPQSNVAKNTYNKDGSKGYKFLFSVKNNNVTIFYYDDSKKVVNLNTFPLN